MGAPTPRALHVSVQADSKVLIWGEGGIWKLPGQIMETVLYMTLKAILGNQ